MFYGIKTNVNCHNQILPLTKNKNYKVVITETNIISYTHKHLKCNVIMLEQLLN